MRGSSAPTETVVIAVKTAKTTHRNTIFVEAARVLAHDAYAGDQYILRVHAPRCAQHATPGSFAHLQCDPQLPMRRPLSIMRTSGSDGWVEFLYRAVGTGTRLLAQRKVGDDISLLGPIGRHFEPDQTRSRPLLIGGGVGIPPMVFLAEWLHRHQPHKQPLVLMGSETPFPFTPQRSAIDVGGVPAEASTAMPLLEQWRIASRLASQQKFAGCYQGYVTQLAAHWLDALTPPQRKDVEIFACGPHPMLAATAKLAQRYGIACQVSLEEFMACAVGGCAGCVVPVNTPAGPAMKRVCVDGPVFDATSVFF
ncbi:MAG: dihydroorotate dehydrogenase electron transfer subunit [Gammaproteobacteria bacterium]|nr:MAG: dihydroorotate dehydrogenase electron transfer subunit [Gammaproteobacteria bacterium]TND05299.1 MAG: dihydroorotate dehydrogenase electron transfer subunit [Gammaproteobacteria bacterium]